MYLLYENCISNSDMDKHMQSNFKFTLSETGGEKKTLHIVTFCLCCSS